MRRSPACLFLVLVPTLVIAQDWRHYGNDPGGSKYSPLTQIDRSNVTRLRAAWTYHTREFADAEKYPESTAFECTPLVVDGVMYVTTPRSRLIALDAETGRELWVFDPKIDRNRPGNILVNRGSEFWSDEKSKRVFLGTADGRLFAIDATSGKPAAQFGDNGWISLREGMADSFPSARWGLSSQVAVWKDMVIVGARSPDGEPLGPSGDVRGFSARTGKLVWRFHVVPHQGEFGIDTWQGEAWKERAGVNPWSMMSVDVERGMVFVPLTSPATDFYGGDRQGANLFGDSILALDAATGKRLWHFQTIHHDLWDWDLPAMPNLVTLHRAGKEIPAVAQVTKTGFTFVLDRMTGKPLYDVEERPVPQSKIPGEHSWPTQPFPVKPPPYARQTMTWDELTDVTPESRAECKQLIEGAVTGPMFRPIGMEYTVMFPGTNGGANWGGASYDPKSNLLFVNSMDVAALYKMVARPEGSIIPYRAVGRGAQGSRFWDHNMYPCQKPPWGSLTAIDLDKGEFRWRVTLGVVDDLIARGIPPTGAPNLGGSIVTAGGLVFIGATNDSRFRAFDKDNGKELWVTKLPASAHATPMTFMGKKSGKQFVVIAAGGGNKYNTIYSDALVAFALDGAGARSTEQSASSAAPKVEVAAHSPASAPADADLFSHKRHAALKLKCDYCHKTAASAERAGFPLASTCGACHVPARADRPALTKLAALPATQAVTPSTPVYRLPDFVFFQHSRHVSKGVACATCHGDLWSQDRIQPAMEMKMKACVDCHRANHATIGCAACHELGQ